MEKNQLTRCVCILTLILFTVPGFAGTDTLWDTTGTDDIINNNSGRVIIQNNLLPGKNSTIRSETIVNGADASTFEQDSTGSGVIQMNEDTHFMNDFDPDDATDWVYLMTIDPYGVCVNPVHSELGEMGPDSPLHVITGSALYIDGVKIDSDGEVSDTPFKIRTNDNGDAVFDDTDTKFLVNGIGNVGIGPSVGDTSIVPELEAQLHVRTGNDDTDHVQGFLIDGYLRGIIASLRIRTQADGDARYDDDDTKVLIDGEGNLYTGPTAPIGELEHKLNVEGDIALNGSIGSIDPSGTFEVAGDVILTGTGTQGIMSSGNICIGNCPVGP